MKTVSKNYLKWMCCLLFMALITGSAFGTWTELTNDDFESGLGNWVDGGPDASLSATHAIGTQCLNLQDDSGDASSAWLSSSLELQAYARLKVEFTYVTVDFSGTENFLVEFSEDGGSSWDVAGDFVHGTDFSNGIRENPVLIITDATHNFTSNAVIRLRCDAGSNTDDVYIDNIVISGEVADSDADGLPDAWELEQFGDLATSNGGDDNYDGDPSSDLEECAAGTSATNPASFFYTPLTLAGSGTFEVSIDAVSNRTYVLEVSEELSPSNDWTYSESIGPILSNRTVTLSGMAVETVQAQTVIGSWYAFDANTSQHTEAADTNATGWAASLITSTLGSDTTNTWQSNDLIAGNTGPAVPETGDSGLRSNAGNENNKTLIFTFTNNTGANLSLESFHYDYRKEGFGGDGSNATESWADIDLIAVSNITGAADSSNVHSRAIGTANYAWLDVDASLAGLSISNGATATFELYLTLTIANSGTKPGWGRNAKFDNLALVGSIVSGDPDCLFGKVLVSEARFEDPSARHVPAGYAFVWGDHFGNNTLDPDKWFVGMRDPISGDLIPGADGDYLLNNKYAGYVTEEDSFVEEGSLILQNQKRSYTGTSPAGTYQYTSGWVASMHRGHLNKGYIEVRAKFPAGDKVWPAIWLVAEDLVWGPEWDLWEYFGYREDVGYDNMGMHLMTGYEQYGNLWPDQDPTRWNEGWIKPFDTLYDAEAWHVYGWEWTDTYARWYIDGELVHTLNKSSSKEPAGWPDEEMYIILNNGVRTASPDVTTTWPNRLQIDYIEVYQ
jgi:beta-glucanase (GH16 family)